MKTSKLFVLSACLCALSLLSCKTNTPSQSDEQEKGYETIMVSDLSSVRVVKGYVYMRNDSLFGIDWEHGYRMKIGAMGAVNSLFDIKTVPTEWTEILPAKVGQGYVIDFKSSPIFTRVYVKEYIDKGGVTGYRVAIDDSWNQLAD